jgi:hypothetical protein
MNWTRRRLAPVERENAGLRTVIIQLRRELENKQGYAAKLELVLHQRLETIDQLTAKLEQSRQQVRHLGLENEILTAMITAPAPPVDAAMLVPK